MDSQLACATFATLTPVLLIAGHFAPGWERVLAIPGGRFVWLVVTVVTMLAEVTAILGVMYPSQTLAGIGMCGTLFAAGGVFASLTTQVWFRGRD